MPAVRTWTIAKRLDRIEPAAEVLDRGLIVEEAIELQVDVNRCSKFDVNKVGRVVGVGERNRMLGIQYAVVTSPLRVRSRRRTGYPLAPHEYRRQSPTLGPKESPSRDMRRARRAPRGPFTSRASRAMREIKAHPAQVGVGPNGAHDPISKQRVKILVESAEHFACPLSNCAAYSRPEHPR